MHTYFDFFVQISVTWSNHASPARQATAAAYVLFHTEEDAWNCIQAIDGVKWSGKQVRACFGTTKYCHAYLRNAACTNAECSYLHEPGMATSPFRRARWAYKPLCLHGAK